MYVFQRTPNWVYEAPGYLAAYPDQVNWLDRNFPYLTNFARFQASFLNRPQNTLKGLQVDPDFHDEHAVSAINKQVRDLRMAFLQSKLGHRPDLLDKMTPDGAANVGSAGAGRPRLQHPGRTTPRGREPGDRGHRADQPGRHRAARRHLPRSRHHRAGHWIQGQRLPLAHGRQRPPWSGRRASCGPRTGPGPT